MTPAEESETDSEYEEISSDESAAEEIVTEYDVPAAAPAADSSADPSVSDADNDADQTDAVEGMPAQTFEQIVSFNEIIDENGNPVEKRVKVEVDAER